ncbi:MAG: hypothetical protein WCR49_11975 [Opitutae bacterium]
MRLFVLTVVLSLSLPIRGWAQADETPPASLTDVSAAALPKSVGPVSTPVGTPPLLAEAIRKSALDSERWAYTQTTVSKNREGAVKEETVVRYDPSLPYEEQWTPLKLDGKEPTERQIKNLREEHDKRRKNRRALGELLDLARATVVEETATTVTYEVSLIKTDNQRLPPDKFRVTARVNKERQALENVAVRLREAFRLMMILKLTSGEGDMDFTSIDPQYAPPITALRVGGEGSILLVKVGGNYSSTRTDFKRVKPYSERFKVKLAPMKFLDY